MQEMIYTIRIKLTPNTFLNSSFLFILDQTKALTVMRDGFSYDLW